MKCHKQKRFLALEYQRKRMGFPQEILLNSYSPHWRAGKIGKHFESSHKSLERIADILLFFYVYEWK